MIHQRYVFAQEVVLMEGTALVEPPASHADDAPVVVVVQGDALTALFRDTARAPLPMRTHHVPVTPEEEKVNSPYRYLHAALHLTAPHHTTVLRYAATHCGEVASRAWLSGPSNVAVAIWRPLHLVRTIGYY